MRIHCYNLMYRYLIIIYSCLLVINLFMTGYRGLFNTEVYMHLFTSSREAIAMRDEHYTYVLHNYIECIMQIIIKMCVT